MEHEFVQNQEQLKPQDERNEEDRSKVGWAVSPAVAHAWGVLHTCRVPGMGSQVSRPAEKLQHCHAVEG